MILLFEQLLNGLQYGVTLFLLAAGLTLIFGIMGVINLAHGKSVLAARAERFQRDLAKKKGQKTQTKA